MTEKNQKTVYVGLSGGVDSSVSALLLKEQGFQVVGVFIDTWHPDFLECTAGDDRRDAMRVCDVLNIPFKVFDAKARYKNKVADYMIGEYGAGRTPNPDIMCNKHVKFGIFFDWATEQGADMVATGHYARVRKVKKPNGKTEHHLLKGKDKNKDQSYFLWAVSAEVFSKVVFPIGEMEKKNVRKTAESSGLPTATKKDSQGICFLGKVDIKQFLSHYIPSKKGDVIDEGGSVIGFHDGAHFYTIGQRHGFTVEKKSPDSSPFYITGKDISKNILRVSANPRGNATKEIFLSNENRIPEEAFHEFEGKSVSCMIRYRQADVPCRFSLEKSGTVIVPKRPLHNTAPGQSLVIYKDERCIGGGIIDKIN